MGGEDDLRGDDDFVSCCCSASFDKCVVVSRLSTEMGLAQILSSRSIVACSLILTGLARRGDLFSPSGVLGLSFVLAGMTRVFFCSCCKLRLNSCSCSFSATSRDSRIVAVSCSTAGGELLLLKVGDAPPIGVELLLSGVGLLRKLPPETLRLNRLVFVGLSFLFSGNNSEEDDDDLCNTIEEGEGVAVSLGAGLSRCFSLWFLVVSELSGDESILVSVVCV